LKHQPARKADREQRSERVGRAARDQETTIRNEQETSDNKYRADQAELLADDREDRVGVGLRQPLKLLAGLAKPLAEYPAAAERVQRVDGLIARAAVVGERIEPRSDALLAVGRDLHHCPERPSSQQRRAADMQHIGARREVHSTSDHDQHDRGAEVTAEHHQAADGAQRDGERDQAIGHVAELFAAPREPIGEVDQHGQLSDLGGLHAKEADPNPLSRPVDLGDRSGQEQHNQQHDQRGSQQMHRIFAPKAIIDPHSEQHAKCAHDRGDELTPGIVHLRLMEGDPIHKRGAVDHHQADRHQDANRRE